MKKKLKSAALFIAVFFLQCSSPEKDMNNAADLRSVETIGRNISTTLTGRWKQTATFFSIGGPDISWQQTDSSVYQYIQLNTDSTMESNIKFFLPFKYYSLIDSATILFKEVIGKSSENRYKMIGDSLDISLHCIEACGARFVKEAN